MNRKNRKLLIVSFFVVLTLLLIWGVLKNNSPCIDCPKKCVSNWKCSSWSLCSNNSKTRECYDLSKCNRTVTKPKTNDFCQINISVPKFVSDYIVANNNINLYLGSLPESEQQNIYLSFEEIESTGTINASEVSFNSGSSKIARSLWIDYHNIVPWKLNDYSSEDLRTIFRDTSDDYVPDCDPMNTYHYAKYYIKNNKEDTVYSIIDSLRRYSHAMGGESGGGGTGCLKDMLLQNSVMGCHASSQMMANLITSLNIPAYYRYNSKEENWFVSGHGELVIPGIGYISHGDNIYGNTIQANIPSKELIIPWKYLQNNVIPLQSSPNYFFGKGENPAEQRYMFDLIVKFPWSGQNTPYCSCLRYAHEMGDGIATEQEIINLVNSTGCISYPWETC